MVVLYIWGVVFSLLIILVWHLIIKWGGVWSTSTIQAGLGLQPEVPDFPAFLRTRTWIASHAVTLQETRRGFHNDVFLSFPYSCCLPFSPYVQDSWLKGMFINYVCYCYDSPVLHAAQSADLVQTLRRLFLVLFAFI